jgi:hypothetical protein
MGQTTNSYRILIETPEGNRPLGRPRLRCEDNIKRILNRIECELDSSDTGYGPVAGSCERSNGLSGFIKGGEYFELRDY